MPETSTLLNFSLAVVALSAAPGPDMVLLITRGLANGSRASLFTSVGFALAGIIQVPLLALGIASLLGSNAMAFDVLRLAGCFYLCWRGLRSIWSAGSTPSQSNGRRPITPMIALRDGLVASLTNPKGLIFMVAFLPQFVDQDRGNIAFQLIVLGVTMKLVALIVEGALALAAGRLGRLLVGNANLVRWMDRLAGAALVGLGVYLLCLDTPSSS